MLDPQVGFLHLTPAAPGPPLRRGAIHAGVVLQRLVLGRHHQTTRADDAIVGDAHRVVYACARGHGVVVSYRGRLDATADFKQVVVSYAHDLLASVDDDGSLFDDAVGADDDGASKSKDGRLWVNDRARSNSDVALEIDVLADDSFRVDRKLVAYGWWHDQGYYDVVLIHQNSDLKRASGLQGAVYLAA